MDNFLSDTRCYRQVSFEFPLRKCWAVVVYRTLYMLQHLRFLPAVSCFPQFCSYCVHVQQNCRWYFERCFLECSNLFRSAFVLCHSPHLSTISSLACFGIAFPRVTEGLWTIVQKNFLQWSASHFVLINFKLGIEVRKFWIELRDQTEGKMAPERSNRKRAKEPAETAISRKAQ